MDFGADRPKSLTWEPDGKGGFIQQKVPQPRSDLWASTIDAIPLTPNQVRSEARRNGLTRRAEQRALQQGLAAMALAYDHQPATKELLQARQFAGKATATCRSCYAEFVATAVFCPDCGVRVGNRGPGAAETVEARKKALKRKLGKKVLAGKITVGEARARLGREMAQRAQKSARPASSRSRSPHRGCGTRAMMSSS